jgi:flagellar hook-associated protein 1 FlgK
MQSQDTALAKEQTTADTAVRADVAKINELGAQIRDINIRINQSYGIDTQPNDLQDTRDKLLGELSKLTDFQGHQMDNGLYDVTIGGHTLVQDNIFVPLATADDPANNNFARVYWTDDNTTATISNGEIQGLAEIRDLHIPVYRQALNDLAQGLMASINPVHAAGYALNAAAPSGLDFFTGTGVQDIQVNPILKTNPDQVAAATNPSAPGDGSNALALAQLKDGLSMSGNTITFGTFYQNLVAQVGLDGQQNTSSQNAQQTLVDSLTQQQESVSGVNLDEEMTNLIKYQDGYNAAIRVITTMDSMLDTLINKMGVG